MISVLSKARYNLASRLINSRTNGIISQGVNIPVISRNWLSGAAEAIKDEQGDTHFDIPDTEKVFIIVCWNKNLIF